MSYPIPQSRCAPVLPPETATVHPTDRIAVEPGECRGRPCIRGLRVCVKDVLDMLAGGATRADILRGCPYLEDADIVAAPAFASRATGRSVVTAAGS